MLYTEREQSQRATEDMYRRLEKRWARYKEMDLKNFEQGGEYGKQVIENFKRKKGGENEKR